MRPVLTPAEMAAADRRAIDGGTPEAVLVERAGRAVAAHARHLLGGSYGRRVVVACGPGNNGADGQVAARLLRARGVGVDGFSIRDGIDSAQLRRALERADLAIDAMFGTGFRDALTGDGARVATAFTDAGVPVLAVDIPSGVDGATGCAAGPTVGAAATTCFAAWKPGLLFEPGRSRAGTVKVVDIGIDVDGVGDGPPSWVVDARDLALPVRGAQDHKWSSAVYVVGGSVGMLGAPLMAARAAQRAGAGMVVCGVPGAEAAARASADEVVLRALPASVLGALQENAATAVLEQASRFRCVAIGPGLGQDAGARAAVRRIVAECPVPLVIDADALNALAADPAALRVRHAAGLPIPILTPHAGEYERLAGRPVGPDRIAAARTLAGQLRAVVLLKGPGTVVADPDGGVWINRTDGAALAAAGTGDVLTGIIAAIVAHGVTPAAAASTAAYVHGRAATVAGTGSGLVATDVTAALPRTLDGLRTGADPWED